MPTAASASAPAPADEEGFDIPRRYFAAAAILIGVLMSALDSSIVNIALPTISADLGVSAASVIWVANGYQVASAAAMLTCASLGSRIGERRFYTAGLALFTIASLGCALAPSFLVLVAMRILQGLSYAVLISVGYGMYRVIFPARSLGTIFGVNALVFAVGTALGPALGGLLVSYASWPWLFYINLPLGIAAIAFSLMALGKDTQRERGFDVLGAATRRRPSACSRSPSTRSAAGATAACCCSAQRRRWRLCSSVARPAPAVRCCRWTSSHRAATASRC